MNRWNRAAGRCSRRDLLRWSAAAVAGGAGWAAGASTSAAEAAGPIDIVGQDQDTTAAWQAALAAIEKAGGGCIRASGPQRLSAELLLPDVPQLEIIGCGCTLKKQLPESEFLFFRGPAVKSISGRTIAFRNLHLLGDWDQRQSLGGNAARGIALNRYHKVTFDHLHLEGVRQMGLTANSCDEVLVDGCTIERNARDGMNLTGSRFVTVSNCTIRQCYDDAIAVHCVHKSTDPAAKYGTVIIGNQIQDSMGIKVLGGENIIIAHNNIMRPKLYGIYLGKDSTYQEGLVPHRNVVIEGNIISDTVRREYLEMPHELNEGIIFVDSGREIHSTLIANNVISKSKPSGEGKHYSDWGYGKLYLASGWRDPELKEPHQGAGRGIRIMAANADDEQEIVITGNLISGVSEKLRVVRAKR